MKTLTDSSMGPHIITIPLIDITVDIHYGLEGWNSYV